jgi:hypothetical protein
MKTHLSWRRVSLALALSALLFGPALAQDDEGDPAASAAARDFLKGKGLKTAKLPADMWVGDYAGSCWTGATRISLTDNDEAAAGLRRFSIERITSPEKENPAHVLESWWVDADGAIVRGLRESFKAGDGEAEVTVKLEVKGGKLRSKEDPGNPDPAVLDLPGAFIPDELLAVVTLPSDKGKSWRFSTQGGDAFIVFTVTDKGEEKVTGRSGEVTARKLALKDPDGETFYWVDDQHRIVSVVTPKTPNLTSAGGTEDECRSDWWTRPRDDFDAATDKLSQKSATLEALAGELTYGVCDKEGRATAFVQVKLAKETRGDKPAFHYTCSIAPIASDMPSSLEEWWLTPEGRPLNGKYTVTGADEKEFREAKVEGDKITGTSSEEDSETIVTVVPPHFVCDAFLLFKAIGQEEKGSFRFNTYDWDARRIQSVLFEVKPKETIALRSGKAEARRVSYMQNSSEATGWVDASGKLLLVRWEESPEPINIFGPLEDSKKDLTGPVGPPAAKSE